MVWIAGAVALQTPGARVLRKEIQRSAILRQLNDVLPPTGSVLNALARFDPFPDIAGPLADVPPPTAAIARDPDVDAAGASVVRVLGHRVRPRREGSGWVAGPGLVVTNAHVVAGAERHDRAAAAAGAGSWTRSPCAFDPTRRRRRPARGGPGRAGAHDGAGAGARAPSGAILGFPLDGPYDVRAARIGPTRTRDEPGRLRRGARCGGAMTALRGLVRRATRAVRSSTRDGQVVGTVFAARTGSAARGRLRRARPRGAQDARRRGRAAVVSTGPCAARSSTTLRSAEPWPRPSSSQRSRPSDATSSRVLPGPWAKHEGYLEGPEHVLTWAVGHLVQLAEPDEYDPKLKKWRMADLPIVPDRFKLVVRDERSKKQMSVVTAASSSATTSTRSSTPATPAARAS